MFCTLNLLSSPIQNLWKCFTACCDTVLFLSRWIHLSPFWTVNSDTVIANNSTRTTNMKSENQTLICYAPVIVANCSVQELKNATHQCAQAWNLSSRNKNKHIYSPMFLCLRCKILKINTILMLPKSVTQKSCMQPKYSLRGCNQKFPDWPPGARTAYGTALCHYVQLCRYFVSQSGEFCRYKPLYCFSTSVYCCLFRYRLSPETFGYTPYESQVVTLFVKLPFSDVYGITIHRALECLK
jgi:hypothetical protein